ncbi:hypothetical protein J2W35_004869 [Variovorax boronicumulans]|uniref:hypothetical protein n=1 Tax=Variovorax boronicumulans TaxID=436515 RepID=UPI0027899620|nr:hypothetical protein [Variovorax boronicumulans]MDQ0084500.1 hypothetical protein [Variovorax boronicumulans]
MSCAQELKNNTSKHSPSVEHTEAQTLRPTSPEAATSSLWAKYAQEDPLPSGYDSWLEYAIAMFAARESGVLAHRVIDSDYHDRCVLLQREVWAQFNNLRALAGLPAVEPKGFAAHLTYDEIEAEDRPARRVRGSQGSDDR